MNLPKELMPDLRLEIYDHLQANSAGVIVLLAISPTLRSRGRAGRGFRLCRSRAGAPLTFALGLKTRGTHLISREIGMRHVPTSAAHGNNAFAPHS